MWFATRGGVSMRTADGTPVRIDSLKVGDTMMYDVVAMQIVEGNNGDMWVTSSTNGVIRIQGKWEFFERIYGLRLFTGE